MARDGSGNYNLPAGNPVVTGTVISSTQFNATMTDVAQAITQSISKDGQTTPTSNLPMGGNKHTGVQDGNLANQYASIGQTQNGSLNKLTAVANVVDAYTGSLTPAIAGYTDGQVVTFVPSVTNTTTTPTLAVNGLVAKPINKEGGVACVAGDLALNVPAYLVYYATGGYFLLLNPQKITGSRVLGLPDTSLSSNVALLNGTNTFANAITVNGAGSSLKGGVTIAAPVASGTALIVNGFSADYAVFIASGSGATTVATDLGVFRNGSTGNSIQQGPNLTLGDQTNNTFTNLQQSGGQTELWQYNSGWHQIWKINTAGGFVVNSPFGFDVGLTVNGVANRRTLQVNGSGTSGQSYGLLVTGGTNSSDQSLLVQNSSGSSSYFLVRGDGLTQAVDQGGAMQDVGWRGTPPNPQTANYTLQLSDRGKEIKMTGSAGQTVTVPANVFSAGDVITITAFNGGLSYIIAQGAGLSMFWAGNGVTSGNRTLTSVGVATIQFQDATDCVISGAGLS